MSNVAAPSGHVPTYNAVSSGVATVGTSAAVLPSVVGPLLAALQADHDNAGYVCVGGSDVATTTGLRLAAGEMTPWMALDDLSRVFAVADQADQKLRYMVTK